LRAQQNTAAISRKKRKGELFRQVVELERRLREQLDTEFGERLRAAAEAESQAQRALDSALVERASADKRVGQKFCEWINSSNWIPRDKVLSGRTGVVEVFGPDTEGRRLRYAYLSCGELIIRILKKDGSRSALYLALHGAGDWLPEGETPPDAKKETA
jgi:hypothetical protein